MKIVKNNIKNKIILKLIKVLEWLLSYENTPQTPNDDIKLGQKYIDENGQIRTKGK